MKVDYTRVSTTKGQENEMVSVCSFGQTVQSMKESGGETKLMDAVE